MSAVKEEVWEQCAAAFDRPAGANRQACEAGLGLKALVIFWVKLVEHFLSWQAGICCIYFLFSQHFCIFGIFAFPPFHSARPLLRLSV